MKLYIPALTALLALAACGSEQQPTATPSTASTNGSPDTPPELPAMGPEVQVLALGDSLFTGYGLDNGISYPAKLETALRARGINARIANAGLSGDTTAGGLQRLQFTLNSQPKKPDLALISLGGNDMLRGLPPEETRNNLDAILAQLKQQDIAVVLLGMLAAPNMGKDYARQFDPIYPSLAKKYGATLVPFFLQPLMDRPDLVQQDHIHPTEAGLQAMVEATVEPVAEAVPEGGEAK